MSQQPAVRIQIVTAAEPTPAQLAAYQWLWRRLLSGPFPENPDAPGAERKAPEPGTAGVA